MMTERENIIKLLKTLDINSRHDAWEVSSILRKHGYNDIKVADGASKICLIFPNTSFVVKWSTYGYEEAMREVEVYQKAIDAHLEKFFPKTAFLVKLNDVNFVVQEKIDVTVNGLDFRTRQHFQKISKTALDKIVYKMERQFKRAARYCQRDLDPVWAKMALVLYGKRTCKALCDFIIENKINDLHESNIGYKNNRPIILDFSGYDR